MENEKSPKTPSGEPAWFPKKKIGYGWGLPVAWQGWAVFLGYLGLSISGAVWLARSPGKILGFFLCFIPLTILFVWICWKKGEAQGD